MRWLLPRKLKAIRLTRFVTKAIENRKEGVEKPHPLIHVSRGFYVVEDRSTSGLDDHVVAQREQIEALEVWLFGVFDGRMGDGVTRYLQSHLFDKKLGEPHIRRKTRETMKKAYTSTIAKMHKGEKANENGEEGCTSVIVMNGEKLMAASVGDYRAVICRDGVATQLGKSQSTAKRLWSLSKISGMLHTYRGHALGCNAHHQPCRSSGPRVSIEKIDNDTEFVVLASNGVWEVMKNQEAVNLIRYINDPQEAAEWLAKDALSRNSKGNISCMVIRFEYLTEK